MPRCVASVGIHAALLARDRTGRGQWVETSLAQGALTWMTQIWNRAETPTPTLTELWRFKDFPPTPCFEAGDGKWFHPMPQGIALARRHLGGDPDGDPDELPFDGAAKGDYETRRSYFAAAREVFLQRDRDEWVALLQANDVSCQPIGTAEAALDHPQVVHNGASVVVDLPGVGPVKQFGHAYRLEHHDAAVPIPPPAVGEHSASVLASLPDATTTRAVPAAHHRAPPSARGHPGARLRHRVGGPVRPDGDERPRCGRDQDRSARSSASAPRPTPRTRRASAASDPSPST